MTTRLKYLALLVLFVSTTMSAQKDSLNKKEGLTWYTNIVEASEVSKATGKPIFAFFTGSDWCGWCKKLQNDVFSKPAFIKWAKNSVTLVELDFPRFKTLSPELAQQNQSLQQTFQVRGYPTIHIFFLNKSVDGTRYDIDNYGSVGYPAGAEPGKEEVKFLSDVNDLFKKKNAK